MGEDEQRIAYAFTGDTSSLQSATRKANSLLSGFSNTIKKVTSKAVNTLKGAVSSLTGINASGWLAEAVNQSIEFTENVNLFTVAMGDAVDVGAQFVDQMSEIYGMDASSLMEQIGNFYQLSDAINMPSESATTLALGLTKMTNDLSSLFNMPIETVFSNLASGMQGMTRAVRKYGLDVRMVTLEQTALSLGISESAATMTEADRQGLRFITMLRQASNASGDFARTIETPANQLKIFKEQMAVLGRAIGDLFINYIAKAIAYINGFIMALSKAINFIGSLFGVVTSLFSGSGSASTEEAAEGTAEAIGGIASSAGKASKALKKLIAPFDELNILQKQTASGGGASAEDLGVLDPRIAEAIANIEIELEDVRMKALDVRDSLLEFFGFKIEGGNILSWDSASFEQNLIEKFPEWTKTIKAVFKQWTKIVNGFKKVWNALAGVVSRVWEKITAPLKKFFSDENISKFIEGLGEKLEQFANFLERNEDAIADFIVALTAISIVASIIPAIAEALLPILLLSKYLSGIIGPIAAVVSTIGLVAAALATLYANSEAFAGAFTEFITTLTEDFNRLFEDLLGSLSTIGESISRTWDKDIQPTLDRIGRAFAPVLKTLSSLWSDLTDILSDAFKSISEWWVQYVEPALSDFLDMIGDLADAFNTWWTEAVDPVLTEIGDSLTRLWFTTLKPIIEKILEIIGKVMSLFKKLWDENLEPLMSWLSTTFAPEVGRVFTDVWKAIEQFLIDVGDGIEGLLDALSRLLDFLEHVFAGDWEAVWKDVTDIFLGLWQSIYSPFKGILNGIIGLINVVLNSMSTYINRTIRYLNQFKVTIPDALGGGSYGFNIKEISTWSIPYLANGGVVTSPTMAMIGEGRYNEAVIPLGNSPQMQELVHEIADAVRSNGGADSSVPVIIYLDGQVIFDDVIDRARIATTSTGVNPLLGG